MRKQVCGSGHRGKIKGLVLISKYMIKKYGVNEALIRVLKRKKPEYYKL